MNIVGWIIDTFRFAFLDTAIGVVATVTMYVFISLGLDIYKERKTET